MPFVLLLKTGMSPNVLSFDAQIRDAMELKFNRNELIYLTSFHSLESLKFTPNGQIPNNNAIVAKSVHREPS